MRPEGAVISGVAAPGASAAGAMMRAASGPGPPASPAHATRMPVGAEMEHTAACCTVSWHPSPNSQADPLIARMLTIRAPVDRDTYT